MLKATELLTLDPLDSSSGTERQVLFNIYESLVGIDPQLNLIPSLALSWHKPDPKTYALKLRQGTRFQDGTDFNAEAVKFNLDRYLTNSLSRRKSELASLESVEVRDASTVILHLKNSDATLLSQLADRAGMMLSRDALRKGSVDFSRSPIGAGTGPFQFVEWKLDDHLTIQRNRNYWRKGLPYLDQIVYRTNSNLEATFASLRTGDSDMVFQLAAKDVAAVKADVSLTYRDKPGFGYIGIILNHGAAPFNDMNKAKAVAMAVNRAEILRNVFQDVGTVARGPISPSNWAYSKVTTYDNADLRAARTVGSGLSFELKVLGTADFIQAAQLIQGQLARAGITVNLQIEDAAVFGQNLVKHKFQSALLQWSGRIDPDGNTFTQFHTGDNFGSFSNQRIDVLLEAARIEDDQHKRKQLYAEAQRLIVDEVAWVFITHPPAQQISSNRVHGFVLYPDGVSRFAEVWKS